MLLTAGEHPATLEACRLLQARGWKLGLLDVDREGRIVADCLELLPWDRIHLATLILAHNETGVVQDVGPLAERCRNAGVPLHLDAVQAVGKIPVNFERSGATAMSLSAHKFHGPRGIGALFLRNGTSLRPRQVGGHQEAGRRAGTEPVALAVGMALAIEKWHADRERQSSRLRELRDHFERQLQNCCAPVIVNGSREHRIPNTLNIAFPGVVGEALLVALDLAGIACSLGSTCASGSTEPAPVLLAMGCPLEIALSSVRFSLGIENTREEIDEAVDRIAHCVGRLSRTAEPATADR